MAKEKKSFILYVDQGEQVGMLSDSEAGRLFKALFCFAGEGKNAYFGDGMTQMCFSFMSAQITRDQEAYREKCAKLSENAKRRKQLHAIEGDTDTVTDTATVTDTVTETETDTVTVTGTVTGTVSGTDTCLGAHAHTHAHGRERAHACDALVVAPQEAPPPPAPRSAPQRRGKRRKRGFGEGKPQGGAFSLYPSAASGKRRRDPLPSLYTPKMNIYTPSRMKKGA